MGFCPDRMPSALSVAQGQARYISATGRPWEGTVTPQGQLMMQPVQEVRGDTAFEMNVTGSIDPATGAAYARQRSNSCSYDFVWQRSPAAPSAASSALQPPANTRLRAVDTAEQLNRAELLRIQGGIPPQPQ
jgi:hypothetical protein